VNGVNRLGYFSSISVAVLAAAFFVAGIFTPARGGPFCTASCVTYPYVNGLSQYVPWDYFWQVPPFLLAAAFLVLIASLHQHAPVDKKGFSLVSLSFATIYAAIVMADYFLQWTVVIPSIMGGDVSGLSLLSQYNPRGLLVALESLAYLLMSTSFLLIGFIFSGGRLEKALRWLFTGTFLLAVGSFLALELTGYDIVYFEVVVITIVSVASMSGGGILAVLFTRQQR
jgi:hypothetical protein